MLLAVDMGNTDIVLAPLDEDGRVCALRRLPTARNWSVSQYEKELSAQLGEWKTASLSGAVLCSVVPALTDTLCRAIRHITGLKPLVITGQMHAGIALDTVDRNTLGADILAADAAAAARYPLPVIVFDYGTATTVTVVDKQKLYRGGLVIPGVKLSLRALCGATSLPEAALRPPQRALCTETAESMSAGALYAAAAMTDGLIDRLETELGMPCTAVATGGLAGLIVPLCRRNVIADSDLLLRGLKLLYELNHDATFLS